MFTQLCPYMCFPLRLVFANLWCFSPLLLKLIPWEQPAQESEGMDAVFVGGTPAILHGAFTGAANGQVL